ncbi:hypothetical protein X975_22584, partial [Stegodyphus mimosarum]
MYTVLYLVKNYSLYVHPASFFTSLKACHSNRYSITRFYFLIHI